MSKSATSRESKVTSSKTKTSAAQSTASQQATVTKPTASSQPQTSFVLSQPGSSASVPKSGASADPRMAEWKQFFLDSGIPEHAATEYAKIFVKERINWPILRSLDKGYLADMGINCVGDQISILQAAKKYSGEQYAPGQAKNASPPFVGGMLRMDEEQPAPIGSTKPGPILCEREVQLEKLTPPPPPPANKRIGNRNEVTSSTGVRSVVKNIRNPLESQIIVRPGKRAAEDGSDIREDYMVKKMSSFPPRQVRAASPPVEVEFSVHVGAGAGSKKKDIFSRLTPKGVKSSPNANLVRVLENDMSRLSTSSQSRTVATSRETRPTLVSDMMDDAATPVSNRIGSTWSSSSRTVQPQRERPAPLARTSSGSTVFSRLGLPTSSTARAANSFRAVGNSGGDVRSRVSIKDRLG